MVELEGPVVADHAVHREHSLRRRADPARPALACGRSLGRRPDGQFRPGRDGGDHRLHAGRASPAGGMFLNQSYASSGGDLPRALPAGGGAPHALASDPVRMAGRYVVIGGPIDRVWYHWLFNWCPAPAATAPAAPRGVRRPCGQASWSTPSALEPPYRDVLETFGIAADRFVAGRPPCARRAAGGGGARRRSRASPSSIPELIDAFAAHLLDSLQRTPPSGGRPRRRVRQPAGA